MTLNEIYKVGRIKELRDKVAKQEATEEEQQELQELEAEAADGNPDEPKKPEDEVATDEAVDELADKLVETAQGKLEAAITKALKGAERTPDVKVVKEVNYVVDKSYGKIAVDELDERKIVIQERKDAGKRNYEVTGKTVAFVNALLEGDKQKLQLLTEGTGTAGGYLVPEEFANMIVEDKRDDVLMRQFARNMTISGDTLHVPSLDARPKANWRSEAAAKATSTAQFNEQVFTPYSLAVIVGLSQELAMDASLGVSGSVVNYVADLMRRSLAEKEEQAFWTGNGSGKPTGVNNYSFTSVDAGGTDTAFADAVKRLYFRLGQGYRRNAVWVANAQALERISIVKDSQNNYLLNRLGDNPFPTLNGRPVYEQNDLPTDVMFFGDFGYYMIVDRQGLTVDFSTEATVGGSSAFEKNLVFVRAEERTDGELLLTNAVRKITGLN